MPILLGGFSLLFIALSITIFIKSYQPESLITFSSDVSQSSVSGVQRMEQPAIVVDIEGAVLRPGVYRLSQGSRIDDLLGFAGGFAPDADMEGVASSINRAALLADGAKIYIPTKQDDQEGGVREGSAEVMTGLIHVNAASQSELETLAGVGPVTAKKIMNGRPYMRLEELVEKKIISQSVFEALKNQLVL